MSKQKPSNDNQKLPGTFRQFSARFPELAACHGRIAEAVNAEGHLDEKTSELVKIGICVGGGLESALRSHVRRATAAGASVGEIEQAIVLGMNTVGFPRTVAAWRWAHEQFERDRGDSESEGSP